jgi:hypothetical protein
MLAPYLKGMELNKGLSHKPKGMWLNPLVPYRVGAFTSPPYPTPLLRELGMGGLPIPLY